MMDKIIQTVTWRKNIIISINIFIAFLFKENVLIQKNVINIEKNVFGS